MIGKNTRRVIPLVSAALTIVGSVIAYQLTAALGQSQSWAIVGAWMAAGIIVTYLLSRLQARSQEESPEALQERVSQLEPELRKQVQARSYGARRQLIEAPLRELDLDITPRLGWVRDPRLVEPAPLSEKEVADDIVAAFESSKRRMLIVGEPGSGKTIAAYSLIEYLDNTEGDERLPLLVNLSAWEAQEDFETFLVDYLCSSVGYEVHERAVASAFIDSGRYSLILDGLDEIPLRLRQHFSERLDEFVRGLSGEVGVIVTCRTQEYEELLAAHSTGLGLVQAVEIIPLTSEQLGSALAELAKIDVDWETLLSQRHLEASQQARSVLSNPLFLNLAVASRVRPSQLQESDDEHEVRDDVLEGYLDRALADQRQYKAEDARHYLTWIARFLNGNEISPFGLKTTDYTVFDLADLTPPDPPRRYGLFGGLVVGLGIGLGFGVVGAPAFGQGFAAGSGWSLALAAGLFFALVIGLFFALVYGLVFGLVRGPFARSAISSRLTLVWPSNGRQLRDFVRRAVRGLGLVLMVGLIFGLFIGLMLGLATYGLVYEEGGGSIPWFEVDGEPLRVGRPMEGLAIGLATGLSFGLGVGLVLGLFMGLGSGLLEVRSVLITSQNPRGTRSRSRIAALTWLVSGLVGGLVVELALAQVLGGEGAIGAGVGLGVGLGALFALRNGGWFLLLQRTAHRRLAQAGNLPSPPYDFLEWGIEQQIFRRVGGGMRFRHNLIQQYLAKSHQQYLREAEARREARREVLRKTRGPKRALVGVFLALPVLGTVRGLWGGIPYEDFANRLAFVLGLLIGLIVGELLTLVVVMLVVSGVVYFFFMRRQGKSFREAIFNWPMVGVAGVVALLLLFTRPDLVSLVDFLTNT
jgi:hypothetical protein